MAFDAPLTFEEDWQQTWDMTDGELNGIKQDFCIVHNAIKKGEPTPEQTAQLTELRTRARKLHYVRIHLCQTQPK